MTSLAGCAQCRFPLLVIICYLCFPSVECWIQKQQPARVTSPTWIRPDINGSRLRVLATPTSAGSGSKQDLIEYQSDTSKYGRGEMHLSAAIDVGDVVVYQTGSWLVDGVVVGDDSQLPEFRYALVETIQLVWTHNCEHGVIRALPLVPATQVTNDDNDDKTARVLMLDPTQADECSEFGPEQLIAKLPVVWDESQQQGLSLIPLYDSLWVDEVAE